MESLSIVLILGVLIPQDITGIKEFRSSAKYILVVEKDAIFQKLLDEGALVRLAPVIIITVSIYIYVGTLTKKTYYINS